MQKNNQDTLIQPKTWPINSLLNRGLKRTFDLCFSVCFLLFLFPFIYILIGIMIKCTSSGPIFFKQTRTGRDGKDFVCYKFRSMNLNEDSDLKQASREDERITKFGKFLRKSNLDEIPQFWNVLLGNMSVVGPRPHMLKHTEEYSRQISTYCERLAVKPGITGWAQVTGFRGEIRQFEQLKGRVDHDIWYITHWTFWLDIKIIFLTIKNIFKGEENAY